MDFIDFNYAAVIATPVFTIWTGIGSGDVNGDGRDDIVTGGNTCEPCIVVLQKRDGGFYRQQLPADTGSNARSPESLGTLFDADGDGDSDI